MSPGRWLALSSGLAALLLGVGLGAPAPAANKTKTYCQYRFYHEVYGYCTDLPPKEAEKDCAARASKKHGEAIECECTNDAETVADRCEPKPPAPPEDEGSI